MKTAQERREQMAKFKSLQFNMGYLAEKIEPYIEKAIEEGQNHLTIASHIMTKVDSDYPYGYPYGTSNDTFHRYYHALANVYKEHGFGVTPIQDTDCGFDDCIYWLGFDIFW